TTALVQRPAEEPQPGEQHRHLWMFQGEQVVESGRTLDTWHCHRCGKSITTDGPSKRPPAEYDQPAPKLIPNVPETFGQPNDAERCTVCKRNEQQGCTPFCSKQTWRYQGFVTDDAAIRADCELLAAWEGIAYEAHREKILRFVLNWRGVIERPGRAA